MMLFIILLYLLCDINTILCMSPVTKDLLTPISEYGEGCGYSSCPIMGQNVINVHIVPSTHAELGYSRTFYEHYTGNDDIAGTGQSKINMKSILDAVITALWAHSNRKFTFSDMAYLFHWWQNRDLTVKRMVYQLLRQGRLYFIGGGWSMSDEATTSYHAIIDHFTYALRKINATFLDCGRPLVTWQSDVFGHSKEFASLMAQMGFDGHFISPISYDDELARMRSKTLEFVWRGSDDLGATTDIYTHKLFDGYWPPPGFCFGYICDDPLIITSDTTFSNVEDRVKEFLRQVHERQSPYYTTKNVMIIMGMRFGYHDAEVWFANIDKLIGNVNSKQGITKYGKVYLFYSTPSCYLKAVHEAMPNLTTKQDDFIPFTYDMNTHATGMYTSRPIIKYLAREMHLYVQIAKQLQIFAQLGNNDQRFEDIMWISGVLQDHNIITGSMSAHVNDYYARKAYLAKELCMQMFRPAFNILRNSPKEMIYYACHFNISSCWTLEGDQSFIVVYNPLAWSVTLPVRLPVAKGVYKVYDPKGQEQNHSIVSIPEIVKSLPDRGEIITEDELVFIAEKIPPLGFRSYYIQRTQSRTRIKRSILNRMFGGYYGSPRMALSEVKAAKQTNKSINTKKDDKSKSVKRQKSNRKRDDKYFLDDLPDYEYFEDATEKVIDNVSANVSKAREFEFYSDNVGTALGTNETFEGDDASDRGLVNTTAFVPSTTSTTSTAKSTSTTPSTSANTTKKPIQPVIEGRKFEPYEQSESIVNTTKMASSDTIEPVMTTRKFVPLDQSSTTQASIEYYYDDTSPEPVQSTTPYFDFENFYRRMALSGYHSARSKDSYIENEYIKINIDKDQKLLNIVLSNGVNITFDIQMCYYVSDDPAKVGTTKRNPGPYMFRPMDSQPILINDYYDFKIIKSNIVEEIHIQYADFAGIALKLYKGFPTIEMDWVVGPVPIADALGKEIFVRYITNLQNSGVFYTDSNGRQTMKRIRDSRPTYSPTIVDSASAVAGNIYPVTSKIYIEDRNKNIRLSVFTDRCQGGTSLLDGHIDLFLHRRIFTEESAIKAILNETEFGQGLIVRGKHFLYLSKADYRPNKVFEKKFAKELELGPKVFTSIHESYFNISFDKWINNTNEYTALNSKLPIGVHILTLEKWSDSYLLRLENYLEKADVARNGFKKVFLRDLFKDFVITEVKETLLGANIWQEDYFPLKWETDRFVKNFNDVYGNASRFEFSNDDNVTGSSQPINLDDGIGLSPQQIRTFVVSYVRR